MARILLVDDDADSRFAVKEVIRRLSSHEVVDIDNGSETLERLGREEFDLLLLDVKMPGMDGFELCRRLRAEEKTQRLPVVFLTASEHHIESRLKGLALGAADFIVQPVDNLELMARISSVLRSKALTDEARRQTFELEGKISDNARQLEKLARELRVERDALRDTFDVIHDGLLLFGAGGEVLLENAAGRRLREMTPEPGDEPASLEAGFWRLGQEAIDTALVQDRTLTFSGRHYTMRAYPVAGERTLVYVRDITEERDGEVRRLQSEKLASIGMLAAGVAHEINNPASFVVANTEALASLLRLMDDRLRGDPAAARRLGLGELLFEAMSILQESKEGLARIHRIVRDLHGFSRVEDAPNAVADVNAAVESALTMLRNELRYRAHVERDLRATRPVKCGAARIGQVFLNLILNAAHALPEGEIRRNRLVVRTYDDGEDVVVEVEDNGSGIAPEVRPRIFESFFTTKPAGLGTGLGLPISREIIRSAGGDIEVETEPQVGSTFRVRLPSVGGAMPAPIAAPPLPSRHRRLRVLAVDDEPLLLKAYRRMLMEHHDLTVALGGAEALQLFESGAVFDVVLCDLQMPEMSGAELYRIVKTRWAPFAERFIIITGGAFSPEAKRFIEESTVARINKPFAAEELLDLMDRHVASRAS